VAAAATVAAATVVAAACRSPEAASMYWSIRPRVLRAARPFWPGRVAPSCLRCGACRRSRNRS